MKTFNRTSLPKEIKYNKKVYVCDHDMTIDIIFNKRIVIPKGYIKVLVLHRNLRGKLDAQYKPYEPSVFYFKPNNQIKS